MIEKEIIKGQKETIHRLQEECKEKTDIIMELDQEKSTIEYMLHLAEKENTELEGTIQELNKVIQDCNIQRTRLYKALEEIRGIAKENYYSCTDCEKQRKELNCNDKCNAYRLNEIQRKINEVLGND